MSIETALTHALDYIADCLERDEVYDISRDAVMRGEEGRKLLITMARKLSTDSEYRNRWAQWCEMREKSRG